jgi:hypothetical protein
MQPSAALVPAALATLLLAACAHAPAPVDPGPPAPVVEYLTRQEILTPLPLRVRLPARYGAERVLVFFHTWGSRDWSMMELAREGQTWSGAVSCREVSTVTGDTRYFFLALDPEGQAVVGSGSPEWPHVATIVGSLPEGPRSLRGQGRVVRCHDPADCPPDFPGCPAYAFVRPRCHSDNDCKSGERCAWDGYCGAASGVEELAGGSDEERLAAAVRRATKRYQTAAAAGRIRR